MRLRAIQLACLLLLVSALGGVEACAVPVRGGAQTQISQRAYATPLNADAGGAGKAARVALTVAAREQQRAVWTVRPPAEQTADVYAVTGSGL